MFSPVSPARPDILDRRGSIRLFNLQIFLLYIHIYIKLKIYQIFQQNRNIKAVVPLRTMSGIILGPKVYYEICFHVDVTTLLLINMIHNYWNAGKEKKIYISIISNTQSLSPHCPGVWALDIPGIVAESQQCSVESWL